MPDNTIQADTPTHIQTSVRPRISWAHLLLGALGFAISSYALLLHKRIQEGDASGCGFTDTISCDKVLASSYGEIWRIPLGVFGMVFFAIIVVMAISTEPLSAARRVAGWRLFIGSVGLLSSVALSYISWIKIGAACPVCMATHATTLLIFLASLYDYLRARKPGAVGHQ